MQSWRIIQHKYPMKFAIWKKDFPIFPILLPAASVTELSALNKETAGIRTRPFKPLKATP